MFLSWLLVVCWHHPAICLHLFIALSLCAHLSLYPSFPFHEKAGDFPGGPDVKNPPGRQGTQVPSLLRENPHTQFSKET